MKLTKIVGCLVIAASALISKPIAEAKHVPKVSLEQIVESDSRLKRERDCLVEALHHEARGESEAGIAAVLTVIHNRKLSSVFKADTYCKVISEPRQFSYRNHLSRSAKMPVQWKSTEQLKKAAIIALANKAVLGMFKPVNHQILWYHTHRVNPTWNRKMQSIRIGNHLFFYRKA